MSLAKLTRCFSTVTATTVLILGLSCSKEDSNPTQPATNSAPQITGIQISMSGAQLSPSVVNTISVGAQLKLTVTASDADDADHLEFLWHANSGSFDRDDSSVVHWTAPQTTSNAQVVVSVSDGRATTKDTLAFNVLQQVSLTGGGVTPETGTNLDTYQYHVTFTDPGDGAPKTSEVIIDGTAHAMSKVSGSVANGAVYQFQTSLESGSHRFSFRFVDNSDSVLILPPLGYLIGPPVTENNTAVIAPDVAVIDALDSLSLSGISGATYSFSYEGTPPRFEAGDIIIGSDSSGYIRKVLSSSVQGNTLTVMTADAALIDAVSRGIMDTTILLEMRRDNSLGSADNVQQVYLAPGVAVREGALDLSNVELFSGSVGEATLTARIAQGSIEFTPDLTIYCDIDNSQIVEFKTVAAGTIYFDCDLELDATASYSKNSEVTIASFKHVQTQFIGFVPVVEVITVDFNAGFEAEAQAGGVTTYGFSDTNAVRFGAEYVSGSWSSIWENTNTFMSHSPSWDASAGVSARGYIRPAIKVELYSVTGPYLDVVPYVAFDGAITGNPICWNWNLSAGVQGSLGYQIHILDVNLADYNTILVEYDTTLASDSDCVDVVPQVLTYNIWGTSFTTAGCGGNVTSDGGATVTARGVCWSIDHNPTVDDNITVDSSGLGIFTSHMTGLTPNTTYFVRAYATNSVGTSYGEELSFKTLSDIPELTTAPVSAVTKTSALSGGDITWPGGSAIIARGVCWSTSPSPTIADNTTTDGTGTGEFTSEITGLIAGTSYYVRAYATNSSGTGYGNDEQFTTTAPSLQIWPKELSFCGDQSTERFFISNTGNGTLSWNIATSQPWISVQPIAGITNSEYDTITVNLDMSGLAIGEYNEFAEIIADGGTDTVDFFINFPGNGPPTISLPPLSYVNMGSSRVGKFYIRNSGGQTLTWSIIVGADHCSPGAGSTTCETDTVYVHGDCSYGTGTYSQTVVINHNGTPSQQVQVILRWTCP